MCNVKEGCFSNLIDNPLVTSYVTTRDIGLEQLQEVIQGHVVELGQTHSANVCLLPEISTNYFLQNTPFKSYDAVITDQSGVFLTIRTADCLPILIFHDSGVVAAVHAGRKGTDLFVLKNTLSKMKSNFSCSNGRFYIWFGPKICFSCYQINKEIDLYYNFQMPNGFLFDSRLIFYDTEKYQENRRFGLWLEGIIAGSLLVLIIFTYYSYYQIRDKTTLYFGLWLLSSIIFVIGQFHHDGSRLLEFIFSSIEYNPLFNSVSFATTIIIFSGYFEAIMFVIFARQFIGLKGKPQVAFIFTNIFIAWYVLHFLTFRIFNFELDLRVIWYPLVYSTFCSFPSSFLPFTE